MEEEKMAGRKKRRKRGDKEGREEGGWRERKKRRKEKNETREGGRGERREQGESQQTFLQHNAHRIPTGWAYRCATGVRVKIFNNRMASALTNGMETEQELGRVLEAFGMVPGINPSVAGLRGCRVGES